MAEEQKPGGLMGLLKNPTVQGVGMAAAAGFNPLMGLLAGPAIKNSRERANVDLEERRQRVQMNNRQMSTQDKLQELMQRQDPISAGGTPIMGIEGDVIARTPSPSPEALEMGAGKVPAISTERGQREMFGLLTNLAPAQASQGLMALSGSNGPAVQASAFLRDASQLFDMKDPEQRNEVKQLFRDRYAGASNMDDLMASLNAQMSEMRLRQMKSEEDENVRQQRIRDRQMTNGVNQVFDKVTSALDLNEQLLGTYAEAGLPMRDLSTKGMSVFNWAANAAGFGNQERDDIVRKAGMLDTTLNELLPVVQTLQEQFGGDMQLAQIRMLEQAKANPESMNPYALSANLAGISEQALDQAIAEGLPITAQREAEIRQRIKAAKSFATQGSGPRSDANGDQENMRQMMQSPQQQQGVPSSVPAGVPSGGMWWNPATGRMEQAP